MKYSFMSFSTPEMGLEEMLETARRYGYDGIEPRLDAAHRHGVEVCATAQERAAIRRRVEQSGVALACLATSLTYADPARTEEVLAQTRDRLALAGDVGAPAIRVFGGQIAEGVSREQAIALLIASLSQVADEAAARKVVICMETHDAWCDPEHVAAVLRGVDHPAVGANWDIMHPVRTGLASIDESFAALTPWIRHLHVHDGTAREDQGLVPIGQGDIDHRRALQRLAEIRYGGYISGEWIGWEPYATHLPRELATLKAYERELGAAG